MANMEMDKLPLGDRRDPVPAPEVLQPGIELGNPNYKDDPDPNCPYCHGLGFRPCNIDGFDTCLICNIDGDHRISGSTLWRLAKEQGIDLSKYRPRKEVTIMTKEEIVAKLKEDANYVLPEDATEEEKGFYSEAKNELADHTDE